MACGRARGAVDIGRWREAERDAAAGQVQVDGVAGADELGPGPGAARGEMDGSCLVVGDEAQGRRGVEAEAVAGSAVASPPESARAAADQAASGIRARCAQSSGGQIRSSVFVRAWPSRTTGSRTSQRRNRRFVVRPSTTVASSARVSRSSASARSCPRAMILASIGSNRPTDLVALGDAGIDPDAVAGRPSKALDAPGRRQEAVLGVLGVEADLDRVAVERGRRPA